jgi:hypothetical protein
MQNVIPLSGRSVSFKIRGPKVIPESRTNSVFQLNGKFFQSNNQKKMYLPSK